MVGIVGQLVNWVLGAVLALGYPGIAVMVGLESTGLPIPGETTLIAASYLAATGHLSLPLVIGSAAVGGIVGDSLGYLVGRKGGRRFLERYGKYVRLTPEKLTRAETYFARYGIATVFFGRFIALLRILAGPLAGASRMPYRRFLVANAAGAVTWATVMGTLAYFFGKPVVNLLSSAGLWALGALIVLLVLHGTLGRWFSRQRTNRLPKQPRISVTTLNEERKRTAEKKLDEDGILSSSTARSTVKRVAYAGGRQTGSRSSAGPRTKEDR